jgi:hypothetical protein
VDHGLIVVLPVVLWLCTKSPRTLVVDIWLVGLLKILVVMRLGIERIAAILSVGPLGVRMVVVIMVVIRTIGNILY